jgi:formyltetrahydrofolate deformylase
MITQIECTAANELLSKVVQEYAKFGLSINNLREYIEPVQKKHFIRIDSELPKFLGKLLRDLHGILPSDAIVTANFLPTKKIVVFVSKEYHCLADILIRNHFDKLGAQVQAVIGNHEILRDITERFGIPFIYITHENKSKEQFEMEIENALLNYSYEYIILAKFMRILSPEFIKRRANKVINIHHSFLPAFVGASPYKQAFQRGVKLIGASAHFVTSELDEGPIITQETYPVSHANVLADMVVAGAEIEKAVLAKAMQLVFQDRVFVYQNRTIIFD